MRVPSNAFGNLQRRHGCGFVVAVVLGVIVLIAAATLVNALILMVLWGAILPKFGVRTIGYGDAYLIALAFTFIGSFFHTRSKT